LGGGAFVPERCFIHALCACAEVACKCSQTSLNVHAELKRAGLSCLVSACKKTGHKSDEPWVKFAWTLLAQVCEKRSPRFPTFSLGCFAVVAALTAQASNCQARLESAVWRLLGACLQGDLASARGRTSGCSKQALRRCFGELCNCAFRPFHGDGLRKKTSH